MKRLIIAAGLMLACFGARAQDVMPAADTLQPRPSVDLMNYGVTTVKVKHKPADGQNVRVVATGARKPNYRTTKTHVTGSRVTSTGAVHRSSSDHEYTTGPRGGCYYLNSNGNKVYVDHSYCR